MSQKKILITGAHGFVGKHLVDNLINARKVPVENLSLPDKKDLDFVKRSKFIIFYYDPVIPMVGTIEELVLAKSLNKYIYMLIDKDKLNDINPWIFTVSPDSFCP